MACEKILLNVSTLDKHGFTASNQAIVISKGFIEWCGDEDKIPEQFVQSVMAKENCNGNLITPGLIDCHTHLVYAGTRASEFKSKLQGKRYDEIANAGGGIASTVAHTRAASEDMLVSQSLPRLKALIREGVTTVEIKSGYGLDLNNELKMLRVARKLATLTDIRIKTTFLGAHAIPPEFIGRNQAYVDFLCQEMLPTVQESGLADAVDVFCESIGFTLQQSEQIFSAAQRLKMPIKCHAEQLSNIGASKLAAHYGALSNDHLEYLDEDGIQAMAQANTVAVLLPGAFYYLREKKLPPIAMLRKAGVGIAIATDCNPGSSPTTSLLLMMNMACLLFGMSVEETLSAVTYQAARALGLQDQVGVIAPGKVADMVLWSLKDSAELCCHFGYPILHKTMRAGQWITDYDSTDAGVI